MRQKDEKQAKFKNQSSPQRRNSDSQLQGGGLFQNQIIIDLI